MARRERDDDSDFEGGEERPDRPARKKDTSSRTLLLVLSSIGAVCLFGCLFLGWLGGKVLPPEPATPPQVYDAVALLQEYDDDRARAEGKFGTRTIRVRGDISDFLGMSIMIRGVRSTLTCFMRYREDTMKVRKGQTVTLEGKISPGSGGGVWLNEARLVGI